MVNSVHVVYLLNVVLWNGLHFLLLDLNVEFFLTTGWLDVLFLAYHCLLCVDQS